MFRSFFRCTALGAAVLAMTSCGSNSPTIPTTPTPTPVTEIFSGTVNVNGAITHQFTASSSGTVSATLTTVGPDEATVLGVALGEWNGSGCAEKIGNDAAVRTSVLYGNTLPGLLCLRVRDVGRLTAPASYEVTVSHP